MKCALAAIVAVILLLAPFAIPDGKKPLTFRVTLMGEIDDKEATEAGFRTSFFNYAHLGFTDFEASDGEKISILSGYFKTANEANRYFDWNLKGFSKVTTQGDKADHDGKTVGRRAELLMKSKQKTWAVMWTNGQTFRVIYAPTLECALEVEKQ